MRRFVQMVCLTALLGFIAIPSAFAEKKVVADPPAAPIPTQILSAKRVFVANGGSTLDTFGIPNLTYDEFYAGMKNWGKYELTDRQPRLIWCTKLVLTPRLAHGALPGIRTRF